MVDQSNLTFVHYIRRRLRLWLTVKSSLKTKDTFLHGTSFLVWIHGSILRVFSILNVLRRYHYILTFKHIRRLDTALTISFSVS